MASFGSILSNTVTYQIANNIYFANLNGGTISKCALNLNGSLATPCTVLTNTSTPIGISLNTKAPFVYIAGNIPPGPNPFQFCPINTDGSVSNCNSAGGNASGSRGMVLNAQNTFAYIPLP